ncbi:hypothetical protein GBA63_22375 (plasmid) [Rubrobacter tropicus]|uniref:Uncharacterized protein n=1 Tax=Rubrobacter tropicus TaxID=2653851 RepID=A0A6G8QG53_9ACTN|nr:hypothetical protein [Rubrobacter tropicus]QIN85450.1 hypothetical protein GBA63_22375 [Rubrobacter tropicus]
MIEAGASPVRGQDAPVGGPAYPSAKGRAKPSVRVLLGGGEHSGRMRESTVFLQWARGVL